MRKTDSNKTMELALKGLVVLNIYDAACTLIWVLGGYAQESNPLMRSLLELNVFSFVITKILLVNFGIWLVWQNRELLFAKLAIIPAFVLYLYVCLGHTIFSINQLLA